jgi:ribonuclease J
MSRIRTYIAPGPKRERSSGGINKNNPQGGPHRGNEARVAIRPGRAGKAAKVAAPKHDELKFIPLGGMEEIGRNCSYFEYKDEIVVVDVGIQFPGRGIPRASTSSSRTSRRSSRRKKNIRGIVLTHGHYDHIAAIHYVIEKARQPDYLRDCFHQGHRRESGMKNSPNAPKLRFHVITDGSTA